MFPFWVGCDLSHIRTWTTMLVPIHTRVSDINRLRSGQLHNHARFHWHTLSSTRMLRTKLHCMVIDFFIGHLSFTDESSCSDRAVRHLNAHLYILPFGSQNCATYTLFQTLALSGVCLVGNRANLPCTLRCYASWKSCARGYGSLWCASVSVPGDICFYWNIPHTPEPIPTES